MKYRVTSLLLSLLLVVGLFGGCMTMPDAMETVIPEIPTSVPQDSGASASQTDLVDAAYELGIMEALEDEQRLTGTVTQIITRYSSKYENVTVDMVVAGREDKPIQCFRLEGPGVQDIRPGDEITVVGQLLNYNGVIEFNAGCRLEFFVKSDIPYEEETLPALEDSEDSAEAVAAYIHTYGCLPDFYMTKNEARDLFAPRSCRSISIIQRAPTVRHPPFRPSRTSYGRLPTDWKTSALRISPHSASPCIWKRCSHSSPSSPK